MLSRLYWLFRLSEEQGKMSNGERELGKDIGGIKGTLDTFYKEYTSDKKQTIDDLRYIREKVSDMKTNINGVSIRLANHVDGHDKTVAKISGGIGGIAGFAVYLVSHIITAFKGMF